MGSLTRFLALTVLASPAAAWLAAQEPAPQAQPEQLLAVIEKGDYEARQQAVQQLAELGEAARPALEKALREAELLEVRETAARLLEKLRQAVLVIEARDTLGRPVPGAEFTINVRSPSRFHESYEQMQLVTDGTGRARGKPTAPGSYVFFIQCRDRAASSSFKGGMVYLRSKENRILYVFNAGGTLKGRVVSGETGAGVKDAEVILVADEGQSAGVVSAQAADPGGPESAASPRETTEAEGQFVFQRAPAGAFLAVAKHEGFVPSAPAPVRVREGGESELGAPLVLSARAEQPGTLRVRVPPPDKDAKKPQVGLPQVEATRIPGPAEWEREAALLRRRMNQARFGGLQAGQQPDEEGWIELNDLRPGVYRVTVRLADGAPVVFKDVRIGSAKTTALEATAPGKGGAVTGRVALPGGEGSRYTQVSAWSMDDPLTRALLEDASLGRSYPWSFRFYYRSQADGNGRYTLKNLAPGKYLLVAQGSSGILGLVFGVDVAAGKTSQAPELRFPGAAHSAGQKLRAAGRVLGSDGKPAGSARVSLSSAGSSFGAPVKKDGAFEITLDAPRGGAATLTASCPEHRSRILDLAQAGLDLRNLEIRLEKQGFGSLRVSVQDREGRPLSCVRVTPYFVNQTQGPDARRVRTTGARGQVLLEGLAFGKRRLEVFLDGYYAEEPVEAEVLPAQETPVTLTLHPGLKLCGRVVLPEGLAAGQVVVLMRGQPEPPGSELCRTADVDAGGRFRFEGLGPGRAILTACAAGCICVQEPKVEVRQDAPEVVLELVRPGGLCVELGDVGSGASLRLVRPDSWRAGAPEPTTYRGGGVASARADSRGRAEFTGAPPGTYDLLVQRRLPPGGARPEPSLAWTVHPQVRVTPLVGGPRALASLTALQVQLPAHQTAVSGRVKVQTAQHEGKQRMLPSDLTGFLCVSLLGEAALATFEFPLSYHLRAPVIVGKPPEGMTFAAPGEFRFAGMPPGEYGLYVAIQPQWRSYYSQRFIFQAGTGPEQAEQPGQLVRSIKLRDGETLDLGEVTYVVPQAALEQMLEERGRYFRQRQGASPDQDEPPKD